MSLKDTFKKIVGTEKPPAKTNSYNSSNLTNSINKINGFKIQNQTQVVQTPFRPLPSRFNQNNTKFTYKKDPAPPPPLPPPPQFNERQYENLKYPLTNLPDRLRPTLSTENVNKANQMNQTSVMTLNQRSNSLPRRNYNSMQNINQEIDHQLLLGNQFHHHYPCYHHHFPYPQYYPHGYVCSLNNSFEDLQLINDSDSDPSKDDVLPSKNRFKKTNMKRCQSAFQMNPGVPSPVPWNRMLASPPPGPYFYYYPYPQPFGQPQPSPTSSLKSFPVRKRKDSIDLLSSASSSSKNIKSESFVDKKKSKNKRGTQPKLASDYVGRKKKDIFSDSVFSKSLSSSQAQTEDELQFSTPTSSGSLSDDQENQDDTWSCKYCTFINDATESICQMCFKTNGNNERQIKANKDLMSEITEKIRKKTSEQTQNENFKKVNKGKENLFDRNFIEKQKEIEKELKRRFENEKRIEKENQRVERQQEFIRKKSLGLPTLDLVEQLRKDEEESKQELESIISEERGLQIDESLNINDNGYNNDNNKLKDKNNFNDNKLMNQNESDKIELSIGPDGIEIGNYKLKLGKSISIEPTFTNKDNNNNNNNNSSQMIQSPINSIPWNDASLSQVNNQNHMFQNHNFAPQQFAPQHISSMIPEQSQQISDQFHMQNGYFQNGIRRNSLDSYNARPNQQFQSLGHVFAQQRFNNQTFGYQQPQLQQPQNYQINHNHEVPMSSINGSVNGSKYVSCEDLSDVGPKKREDQFKSGFELIKILKQAEEMGFTADDVEVALNFKPNEPLGNKKFLEIFITF